KLSRTKLTKKAAQGPLLLMYLMTTMGEELLRVQSCHAAHARSRDGLAIAEVSNISGYKHAFNVCLSLVGWDNISFVIQTNLILENPGIRLVPNGYERTFKFHFGHFTRNGILDAAAS